MAREPPSRGELREPSDSGEPERETRALWIEVAAVLLIGVVPDLWSSFTSLIWPETASRWPVVPDSARLILYSFQIGALVLYLMRRSGTPWASFGLVAPRWVSDTLWTVAAVIGGHFAYAFYAAGVAAVITTESLIRELEGIAAMYSSAATPGETLLVGISCVANGFTEELVMRGYLIPRFERLLGSSLKAVLLSSLLFGSYHLYQGAYGAGSALVFGLVYGAVFCWSRRLWPLAAAHAFWGLESMLGLPG